MEVPKKQTFYYVIVAFLVQGVKFPPNSFLFFRQISALTS